MAYIAFARKYRPNRFEEVSGQSHITTTLKNAILAGRVSHAYLFAGPRGVGKTTTARILAKALNCERGPKNPDPCNACASCAEITQGRSLDVLEIDGASNRGIDEIRNLRDSVKFAPSKGGFKVYIIDEVHMLTPEAFNALLKTLEEPPPHVKFIFATTHPHKVPLTILSRCQRFDFRRIPAKDIFQNLKKIASDEKIDAKDTALELIAARSEGSMRDGQIILDQIVSFTRGEVKADDVVKVLGLVDEEILFGLSASIKEKDPAKALGLIAGLVDEGKDPSLVVVGLIEHFRDLLIAKTARDYDGLLEGGKERAERLIGSSEDFTIEDILYIIYSLSNAVDFIRKTNLTRIPLEAAMVKLTRMGPVVTLKDIMEKLENTEPLSSPHVPSKAPAVDNPPPAKEDTPERGAAPKAEGIESLDGVLSHWNSIIDYIRPKKISIASYLQEGYPAALEGAELSIAFPKEFQFHKEVLEKPENKRLVEEAVKEVLKIDAKITLTLAEAPAQGAARPFPEEGPAKAELAGDKEADPIIKDAMEIFNAEIITRRGNKGR